MSANNQIFVTSVSKAIDKGRLTGTMDFTMARLYYTLARHYEWMKVLHDAEIKDYTKEIKIFRDKMARLKAKYSNQICHYKTIIPYCGQVRNIYPGGKITTKYTGNNTPPVVTDTNRNMSEAQTISLSKSDFLSGFSDANGDTPYTILLYFDSLSGILKFDNQIITGIFELNVNDIDRLTYTRDDKDAFSTSIKFRVSDYNAESKYSNKATFTISGTQSENQPATIDDNSITVDHNITTVVGINLFLTRYADPENDPLDAIKITKIHTTNLGQFQFEGSPIYVGLVISREDIEAEKLVHIGISEETFLSDAFDFQVRDEGSLIWVD